MKYLLFGNLAVAKQYAEEHEIPRSDWRHVGSWDQCVGLDPKLYEAVYLFGTDKKAKEYWENRRAIHGVVSH